MRAEGSPLAVAPHAPPSLDDVLACAVRSFPPLKGVPSVVITPPSGHAYHFTPLEPIISKILLGLALMADAGELESLSWHTLDPDGNTFQADDSFSTLNDAMGGAQ